MKKLNPELQGAEGDWPNVAYNAQFDGFALIAFLDLLGFSQKIAETWGTPESILPVILGLKERVNQPPKIQLVVESTPGYFHSDAFSISDSIILRYPLKEKDDVNEAYWAFLAMTGQINEAMGYAAEHGFAIRGGVEFGPVYWNGNEIIGPAFNTAYQLESKVAKSARVVVGPNLLRKFGKYPSAMTVQAATILYQSSDGLAVLNRNLLAVPKMRELQTRAPAAVQEKYWACITKTKSIEQAFGENHNRWNGLADAVESLLTPQLSPTKNDLSLSGSATTPKRKSRRNRGRKKR